jgi:hypothetical protein
MRQNVLLVLMSFMGMLLLGNPAEAEDPPDCDPVKGDCIRKIGDKEIILGISPAPIKAMEELVFRIVIRQSPPSPSLMKSEKEEMKELPEEIAVDLTMPGMYMGKNRVILKRESPGKYAGKGIIPPCASGRRLWKATVTVAGIGTVDFLFNVTR